MGMHKVPVDNFIVFYTITDDTQTVTIIRIVYGGRDIEGIASETNNEYEEEQLWSSSPASVWISRDKGI